MVETNNATGYPQAMSDSMKIKVTYFNFEGAAEKVRLALAMTHTPFEDEHVSFADWAAVKPTLKYRQLPVMEVFPESC